MSEPSTLNGLRDYVRVVRQQRWLILPIALLFTAAALVYSLRAEKVYRAEASLLFQEPSSKIDELGGGVSSRRTTEERAAIGADVVTRPDIVRAVKRDLGGKIDASVTAAAEARSNLVVVRVSASGAERAARVANAFAKETQRVLRREYRAALAAQIRAARPELRRIRRLNDPVVVAQALARQGQLRALRRLGEPAALARRATVPAAAVSPRPARNTVLGFIAGLTLGLVAAFGRHALDRRLRSVRDLSGAAGVPVLGRLQDDALGKLPQRTASRWAGGRTARAVQEALEDIRIVRANLTLIGDDAPVRILVTSALPEEGKSTVAYSLAVASCLAGKRTVLVECDLRRPVLAKRLALEDGPGLSEYLEGRSEAGEIIRPVQPFEPQAANGSDAEEPMLACVPAGTLPSRPAELLASERFVDFLHVSSHAYETVILDSSPLLPVADTIELVPHVDRVVLCARSRQTTRDQLRAATEAVARVGEVAVGIVVTGVRKGDEEDYGYYQSGYGEHAAVLLSAPPESGRAQ